MLLGGWVRRSACDSALRGAFSLKNLPRYAVTINVADLCLSRAGLDISDDGTGVKVRELQGALLRFSLNPGHVLRIPILGLTANAKASERLLCPEIKAPPYTHKEAY